MEVILQRPIVCFWSRTQKIKYVIFSKLQSIRFSAMKIHRNAVKIIVFDDNTEISTVKIELLLVCADNMGYCFNT